MQLSKKELEGAEELDDVLKFVVELIKVIKEGGNYLSLLDDLAKAIHNANEIPLEVKEDLPACIAIVSLRAAEIVALFLEEKK